MDLNKTEVNVLETIDGQDALNELKELELSTLMLIGGGCGEVILQ